MDNNWDMLNRKFIRWIGIRAISTGQAITKLHWLPKCNRFGSLKLQYGRDWVSASLFEKNPEYKNLR